MSLLNPFDPKDREINRLKDHVRDLKDKITALEVELALVRDPQGTNNPGGVTFCNMSRMVGTASCVGSWGHSLLSSPSGLKPWP